MDLVSHVTWLGGATDRATLLELCSAKEIDDALQRGLLEPIGRHKYALPNAHAGARTATALGGVLSHRSAAQRLGWKLRTDPKLPEVTFPRDRRLRPDERKLVIPHWSHVPPHEIDLGMTTTGRTLVDCMRNLPFEDALAIVNSAIREDDIDPNAIIQLALSTRGRGRQRIIGVAEVATSKPANPFESAMFAIALTVRGLNAQPQHGVKLLDGTERHPDLCDPALRIIIEAESFEWHGKKAALTRDCVRYNAFTLAGWVVYRFSWWQVIHEPQYVHDVLTMAVELAARRLGAAS
ncbi:MAG TPA: hypothetical protein VFK34_12405 [Marmoricola sp.]|nr:hypothetical protein [Marmoricola sp.]